MPLLNQSFTPDKLVGHLVDTEWDVCKLTIDPIRGSPSKKTIHVTRERQRIDCFGTNLLNSNMVRERECPIYHSAQ